MGMKAKNKTWLKRERINIQFSRIWVEGCLVIPRKWINEFSSEGSRF